MNNVSKKVITKVIISIFTSTFGLVIIGLMFLLYLFGAVVGFNSGSVDGTTQDDYKISIKLVEEYKDYQSDLEEKKEVNLTLKYIYAMDSVNREGSFEPLLPINVNDENSMCFFDSEKENIYDDEHKKEVYDCLGYDNNQINMFEYGLRYYEQFGEDDESNYTGTFLRPIENGVITNEFMGVDLGSAQTGHTGIDIGGKVGEPIYAMADGVVIRAGFQSEAGNNVIIKHKIENKDYVSFYGHMNKTPLVKVGDKVTVNTKLGELGATGNVTGPHCHFEIQVNTTTNNHDKAVNPREYIDFPKINVPYHGRGTSGNIDSDKKTIMKKGGVKESDYGHADYIIFHESSWNYTATNASSGAYGLCQALPPEKLADAGDDWKTNPITQMKWCNTYAHEAYGSWAKAEEFWRANHWW